MKSLHFIAILSCCLLAAAPHNFAQDRPQNPAATSKPADGLPPTEPFDPFLGNEADFEDLRSNDAQAELVLKVFTFQNIDATWAHQLICELFRGDLASRAVDQRSNALIVRGNTKILAEIEALLLRLDSVDTQETKSHSSSGIVQSRNVPVWKADNNPFLRLRNDSAETVGSLRDHYNELDAKCVTIARQIHKSEGKTTGQTKSQRTLERELDVAVGNAFRARQRLQRAELAAFQARTKQIGQSIELRDRIADQIIKRRVQQLLDPSVQWDNTLASHPSPSGQGAAPRHSEHSPNSAMSFAERVEADVAQRKRIRAQITGRWVLARTKNSPKPQYLDIDAHAMQFLEAGSEFPQKGTFRLDSRHKGQIVVDFGKINKEAFGQWMGSYEITNGELAIRFDSGSIVGGLLTT